MLVKIRHSNNVKVVISFVFVFLMSNEFEVY